MKIAVFTRTGFHHTYFINRLQKHFDIACVVRESYPESYKQRDIFISGLKNIFKKDGIVRIKDDIFIKKFCEMYSAGFRYHPALKEYLKSDYDVVIQRAGTKYIDIKCGEINSDEFAKRLKETEPDIIAVLGSSIIKPHIISIPRIAMINLHSGLSPYYRGTWSYGWPLVNGEPEYLGVTVHHVNPGVDSGDIICQTKPVFEKNDDLNAIFLKIICEGTELIIKTIETVITTGSTASYKQTSDIGRQYFSKDFNSSVARICLTNLENGVIEKYNLNRSALDSAVKLYGYIPPSIYR